MLQDPNVGASKLVFTDYQLTGPSAPNYTLLQPDYLKASVTPRELTISGLSAVSRIFNNTAGVALSGTANLVGVVPGESVLLSGTAIANFANSTAAPNKAVTVSGFGLSGVGLGNYTLTQPTGLIADVAPSAQTITIGSLTG
jgi:hypothetical protein